MEEQQLVSLSSKNLRPLLYVLYISFNFNSLYW